MQVREQFPALEGSGVKVGAKEVREAVERLAKQCVEVSSPLLLLFPPCFSRRRTLARFAWSAHIGRF